MEIITQMEEIKLSLGKENDNVEVDMYKLMDLTIEVGRLVFDLKLIKDIDEKREAEIELKEVINDFEEIIQKYFEKDILIKKNIINHSSKVYELFSCMIKKIYGKGYEFKEDNKGKEKKELICNLASIGTFVESEVLNSSIGSNKKIDLKINLIKYLYYSYINIGNNFMEEEAVVISEIYQMIIRYYKKTNKNVLDFENLVWKIKTNKNNVYYFLLVFFI